MNKKYLYGLLIIFFCFVLVGCGETEKKEDPKSIIGTWVYPTYEMGEYTATLVFNEDGSGSYSFKTPEKEQTKYLSYKIEDKGITIKFIDNVDLEEFANHFAAYLSRYEALKVTYDEFLVENNILSLIRYGDPSFKIDLKKVD